MLVTQTPAPPERFIGYLPAIYQEDDFMRRFLRAFDEMLWLVETHLQALPHQFDAALAAPMMVDVIVGWVVGSGLPLLPEHIRRALVREYVALWRRRGTAVGLRRLLDIVVGPDAVLSTGGARGFVVGPNAVLGSGLSLEEASGSAPVIAVSLRRLPAGLDIESLAVLIRAYKTAGAEHRIELASEDGDG